MSFMLVAAAVGASTVAPCALPFDVVRDEAAARAIARVVIASAPVPPSDRTVARYELLVDYARDRRSWIVLESPVSSIEGVRILGGGGLGMEIAACDGTVSNVGRQR